MYYGIVAVTAISFSSATEFIPEINEYLSLVPFKPAFRITLTSVMLLDYGACWIIEKVLKFYFSDYRPKDIAVRRKDQLEAEQRRRREEIEKAERA